MNFPAHNGSWLTPTDIQVTATASEYLAENPRSEVALC